MPSLLRIAILTVHILGIMYVWQVLRILFEGVGRRDPCSLRSAGHAESAV